MANSETLSMSGLGEIAWLPGLLHGCPPPAAYYNGDHVTHIEVLMSEQALGICYTTVRRQKLKL